MENKRIRIMGVEEMITNVKKMEGMKGLIKHCKVEINFKLEIKLFAHIVNIINYKEDKIFEEQKIQGIEDEVLMEAKIKILDKAFIYSEPNDHYYKNIRCCKKHRLIEIDETILSYFLFEYIRAETKEEEEITLIYKLTKRAAIYMLALKAKYKRIKIKDIKRLMHWGKLVQKAQGRARKGKG